MSHIRTQMSQNIEWKRKWQRRQNAFDLLRLLTMVRQKDSEAERGERINTTLKTWTIEFNQLCQNIATCRSSLQSISFLSIKRTHSHSAVGSVLSAVRWHYNATVSHAAFISLPLSQGRLSRIVESKRKYFVLQILKLSRTWSNSSCNTLRTTSKTP